MINRVKELVRAYLIKESFDYHKFPIVHKKFKVDDLKSVDITFLVTVGRSGTKTLIDYLRKNSNLCALHAPKPCLATLGTLVWQREVDEISAQWSYFSAREKYLIESYQRNISFVDGDCKNLPLLPALSEFFPKSKFVHVVRDPVKFICSGLNRGYFLDKEPVFWGHLFSSKDSGIAEDIKGRIRLIAEFWEIGNVIAHNIREGIDKSRFVTLRSEDMFCDSRELEKAFSIIGFEEFSTVKSNALPKLNGNKIEKIYDYDLIVNAVKEYCPSAKIYYPNLFE